MKAILANMIWPAFLDRYLAKNVYSAQEQTEFLFRPSGANNLMTQSVPCIAPAAALMVRRGGA